MNSVPYTSTAESAGIQKIVPPLQEMVYYGREIEKCRPWRHGGQPRAAVSYIIRRSIVKARIIVIILFYLLAVGLPAVLFWKLFQVAWPDGKLTAGARVLRTVIIVMLAAVAVIGILIIRKFVSF